MTAIARFAVLAALAAATPVLAQPAPAQQPASCLPQGFFAGPAAYKSVEQLPDGRVTFRICAPDAKEARVTSNDIDEAIPMGIQPGSARGLVMSKDATGLWTATTAVPVPPDTYRFNFQVDGARVPDPQGTTFSHERVGTNSTFETTGPEGEFQTWKQDVPHGAVSRVEYWSSTLGQKRVAMVYTPPGYMNGSERYPVLYLVHGAGDSYDSWTSVGHANLILDNLIAAGKARPMIIVMPFGHTPDRPGGNILANTDFGDDLIKDLIPYVDGNFRTLADQHDRAMAGLSMGGFQTFQITLNRLDLFSHIGGFSGAGALGGRAFDPKTDFNGVFADPKVFAKKVRLLWLGVGTAEPERMREGIRGFHKALTDAGIAHVYWESPGTDHEWQTWRRNLNDFAPRLFR